MTYGSSSPEGTLFETMRARNLDDDSTEHIAATQVRVFGVSFDGGRTKGTLFELAINWLTASHRETCMAANLKRFSILPFNNIQVREQS